MKTDKLLKDLDESKDHPFMTHLLTILGDQGAILTVYAETKAKLKKDYPTFDDWQLDYWTTRMVILGYGNGDVTIKLDQLEEPREITFTIKCDYGS